MFDSWIPRSPSPPPARQSLSQEPPDTSQRAEVVQHDGCSESDADHGSPHERGQDRGAEQNADLEDKPNWPGDGDRRLAARTLIVGHPQRPPDGRRNDWDDHHEDPPGTAVDDLPADDPPADQRASSRRNRKPACAAGSEESLLSLTQATIRVGRVPSSRLGERPPSHSRRRRHCERCGDQGRVLYGQVNVTMPLPTSTGIGLLPSFGSCLSMGPV